MISLLIASACLSAGSFLLVTAGGVPRPHRLSGTLVLSLAVLVVMSIATGAVHRYEAGTLLGTSVGYALLAALAVWLVPRFRPSPVSIAIATTAPVVPDEKWASRSVRTVANSTFSLLLLANLGEYGWRSVLAVRLPQLGYDPLYYHLINISQWVRHHALVDPFIGLTRGSRDPGVLTQADTFPKNAEFVGGWLAVFTRSMVAVGLTQILFVAMLGISVTGVCRAIDIPAAVARIAGALACLCPAVIAQSDQLYVDIARTAPVVAAFEFVLIAYPRTAVGLAARANLRRAAFPLGGLALGFAAGVKPSNLLFIGVVPAVALGLSLARTRADNAAGRLPEVPRSLRISSLALLLVPATIVGSYWYVRSWAEWGSPFWPYATGPFGGRSAINGLYASILRSEYHTNSPLWALLKSWWAATSLYDGEVRGDAFTGGLGVVWLAAGIPAVLMLLLRSHWNRRAAFAVVLPLALGTLLSPAAFNTRYSIPLAVCGVVAVAALLTAGIEGKWQRVPLRLIFNGLNRAAANNGPGRSVSLGVAGFTAIVTLLSVLALSDAWAATRIGNWPNVGRTAGTLPTLRQEIGAVRAPGSERATVGLIGEYATTMNRLDPREPIAFFADQTPLLTYPLLGPDQERDLVVLPAPADLESAAVAKHDGIRYLYLPLKSPIGPKLPAQHAKLVGPVFAGYIFDLSPSPLIYRHALPTSDEVSVVLPGVSTEAPAATTNNVLTGLAPRLTGGCGTDGVGSDASMWTASAPYALSAAACEFTNDTTPDRLAGTIDTGLYRQGFRLKYANKTGLTQEFEKQEKGTLRAVIVVRLWKRLAIIRVTTGRNGHAALVALAGNVTARFEAIN